MCAKVFASNFFHFTLYVSTSVLQNVLWLNNLCVYRFILVNANKIIIIQLVLFYQMRVLWKGKVNMLLLNCLLATELDSFGGVLYFKSSVDSTK